MESVILFLQSKILLISNTCLNSLLNFKIQKPEFQVNEVCCIKGSRVWINDIRGCPGVSGVRMIATDHLGPVGLVRCGLCGLGLLSTDVIKPHQIGTRRNWRPHEPLRHFVVLFENFLQKLLKGLLLANWGRCLLRGNVLLGGTRAKIILVNAMMTVSPAEQCT